MGLSPFWLSGRKNYDMKNNTYISKNNKNILTIIFSGVILGANKGL